MGLTITNPIEATILTGTKQCMYDVYSKQMKVIFNEFINHCVEFLRHIQINKSYHALLLLKKVNHAH